ncbi:MAG: hypothetical protein AB1448_10620 [Pseudomonadota bacterium]
MERSARIHRIASWVIFAALLLSAFLPSRYSLFSFAVPFGMVSIAAYYVRFRRIAELEHGLLILLAVVVLQAGASLKTRFDRADTYEQLEQLVCRSDYADRAGEELCNEAHSLMYPEPDYEAE